MLLFRLRKDQDVVQVHYDNPFRYDGPEDIVHHSLEGSRAVGHSEEHHEGFEEASVGTKDRLPLISGLDAYIIETPADIQFCEVPVMGIKRFDHRTKVKARSERRNLQAASQLCTKQVGTGEIN